MKILVVDDDAGVLGLLSTILKGEGFEVEATTDPDIAIEWVRDSVFDIVIIDSDSLKVARSIRSFEQGTPRNIPVLLLTGDRSRLEEFKANPDLTAIMTQAVRNRRTPHQDAGTAGRKGRNCGGADKTCVEAHPEVAERRGLGHLTERRP